MREINDNPKEKMSLEDILAPEAAGNEEDELFDDPEAAEADASNLYDLKLPQLYLNACYAKELQVEPHSEETSKVLIKATALLTLSKLKSLVEMAKMK